MKKIIGILIFIIAAGCSQKIVPRGEGEDQLSSEKAVKGQQTFMRTCNRCHPGGMAGLGPGIINKPLPGFLIKFQVRNGLGAMPSFDKKRITKEELDNLIEYIKKL